jgi:predicted homoserine dehydrogenase-like protein
MFGIAPEIKHFESIGRTIRVGLIGAGQMGTDIVSQISLMPSQQLIVTADLDRERAIKAYQIAGHDSAMIVSATSLDELNRAVLTDHVVAVDDYTLVTDALQVEAVIESTGSPEASAAAALRAIYQRKHLITMSVEMDITVGPLINWYANRHGVIYSLGAGDEPSALCELYDFATSLGLTIVAAGKGKNNPLNRDATPDMLADEAARRGLTPEMLVEFVDGSKTMIEMASVANATGLVPDVFGLHGPRINISQFKDTFKLKQDGGVLDRIGVVDYVIGDLAPGVFLVFTTDKPRLREALILRDMGQGPNYVLLRPFHLCSMEVPLSVARAVLQHRSTMTPRTQLVAEVVSVAKRDLTLDTRLERIGGRTHYGMTTRSQDAQNQNALPIGIARDARVCHPVTRGQVITYDDVELPRDSVIVRLRRLQDDWMADRISESTLLRELNHLVVKAL